MRRAALFIVGVALTACSDSNSPSGGGGGGTPAANQVFMQSSAFNPGTRTVTGGTSVEFVNKDGVAHNATSNSVPAGASAFGSSNLTTNGTFSVNLTVPGTYQYHCTLHGTPTTGMRGTIVVN